jgi:predicted CXXCH cytochrome family protein
MHNSQNGSPLARVGTDVGWGASGLTGTLSAEPMGHLLVTGCVGCHTSTTSDTIVNYGGSSIPIVYNTVPPVSPLAGGNFYWVAQGGAVNDTKGHNVYGISGLDANIPNTPSTEGAPGRTKSTCGGVNSCHMTLAVAPTTSNFDKGGCQGCHYYTFHHDDNGVYRFLKGHQDGIDYVTGVEDPDWEQDPTVGHNNYQGYAGPVAGNETLEDTHSMSSFCGGCHGVFHRETTGSDLNIGVASPWLRHPSDILLPNTGEYAGYNPATAAGYSAEAPVAWTNPSDTSNRSTAVVMCLSCHRVHGSDQPDLLRWDYTTMEVGAGGSGGCFTCHTSKS